MCIDNAAPLVTQADGTLLLMHCSRCAERLREPDKFIAPDTSTADGDVHATHGNTSTSGDNSYAAESFVAQCRQLRQTLEQLVGHDMPLPAWVPPRVCEGLLQAYAALKDVDLSCPQQQQEQPRHAEVRFMDGARYVYLCAQCDRAVHFGSPAQMQTTLFRDREVFQGGLWRKLDRASMVGYSDRSESVGLRPVALVVFPDIPCRCPCSNWQLHSTVCDLVIVHDGVRVFKAAKFICSGCNVSIDQSQSVACNRGFFPLGYKSKHQGPVKWISFLALQALQSIVGFRFFFFFSWGFVAGWGRGFVLFCCVVFCFVLFLVLLGFFVRMCALGFAVRMCAPQCVCARPVCVAAPCVRLPRVCVWLPRVCGCPMCVCGRVFPMCVCLPHVCVCGCRMCVGESATCVSVAASCVWLLRVWRWAATCVWLPRVCVWLLRVCV